MMRKFYSAAVGLLALSVSPSGVRAQLFNLERVVQVGQPSPTLANSLRFADLSRLPAPTTGRELPKRLPKTICVTRTGQIALIASLQDSFARQGIFLVGGQEIQSVLLAGDVSAGPGLGRFVSFKELAAGPDGSIVFVAAVEGNPILEGIFLVSSGRIRVIARENDPVPGFGGERFRSFRIPLAPVPGSILFLATTDRAGESPGIFQFTADTLRILVNAGNVVPGDPKARFLDIEDMAAGTDGSFIFSAALAGGQTRSGLFSIESKMSFLDGAITSILRGGASPSGNGGEPFLEFGLVSVISAGRYVFSGRLRNGLIGIFSYQNRSLRTISLEKNSIPGLPEHHFRTYDSLETNERGDVVFRGLAPQLQSGDPQPQGLFLFDASRRLVLPVAVTGATAENLGGRRFTSVASSSLSSTGTIGFAVTLESNLLGKSLPSRSESALLEFAQGRSRSMVSTGQPSGLKGPTGIQSIQSATLEGTGNAVFTFSSLGTRNGLMRSRNGALSAIAVEGERSAAGDAGEFEEFGRVVSDNSGRLLFAARMRGGRSAGGLFRSTPAGILPVILLNQVIPGGTGERLTRMESFSTDRVGHVAISGSVAEAGGVRHAVFAQDSEKTVFIAEEGQVAPGTTGQRFRHFQQVANSGRAFVAFVGQTSSPLPRSEEGAGLYQSNGGLLQKLAGLEEPVPGHPTEVFRDFGELSMNRPGQLLFTAVISKRNRSDLDRVNALFFFDGLHLELLVGSPASSSAGEEVLSAPQDPFLYDDGSFSIQGRVGGATAIVLGRGGRLLPLIVEGTSAPGLGGLPFGRIDASQTRIDSEEGFVFRADDVGRETLYQTRPASQVSVRNGGFEMRASQLAESLPSEWTTSWTNSGTGTAFQANTGRRFAFEGDSYLRLHAGPGGGAVFVLSNPIEVESDHLYNLTAQLRFALTNRSEEVTLTVLELDDSGNILSEHHFTGRAGDNHWQWQSRRIVFATHLRTESVRIRFGLVTDGNAFLDVDGLR